MDKKLKFTTLLGKIKFRLTEKIDQKCISKIRNKIIKNKDFTIISNNCFGGWVYRCYNLPYLTPTIGLFIMPKCYLKLISNFKFYMDQELQFINPKDSIYYDYLKNNIEKFGQYPIGKLGDIEIQFLHYKSIEEAKEKWERRKARINYDKLIYKFNDQNGCKLEDLEQFCSLQVKNKICFIANKEWKIKNTTFINEFDKNKFVIDDTWFCRKHMNLTKFINNI